jgi:hypothetical protein
MTRVAPEANCKRVATATAPEEARSACRRAAAARCVMYAREGNLYIFLGGYMRMLEPLMAFVTSAATLKAPGRAPSLF